ncbi:MAG: Rab family GTPase [Candidatus Hodarchaeales archaeon]|jgi:small GTP-binding protein
MPTSKFFVSENILTVKVIVAGAGGVGKTTLLKRVETNDYIPAISTVGVNFLILDQEIGDTVLRIAYWDYAGEERFRTLFPGYCQGSSGGIVAFDTSRIQTLTEVPIWLEMMRAHNPPNIPIFLIGNKIDTVAEEQRQGISEAAERVTKENNLSGYYFCSAKSGEGISSPFSHLGILIVENEKKKNFS